MRPKPTIAGFAIIGGNQDKWYGSSVAALELEGIGVLRKEKSYKQLIVLASIALGSFCQNDWITAVTRRFSPASMTVG